jgi:L-lactate utilization protein LutC
MYNSKANTETVEKVAEALKARNIRSYIAKDKSDAIAKITQLIPEGSQVMTMTSITLETLGLNKLFNESGKYESVKAELSDKDSKLDAAAKRALGAAPQYAIGSLHAMTEDGEIIVASATGSQLPGYSYGAEKVIFVVGTQKIVKDRADGMKRIHDYVLPLESVRANKAYNITSGSSINKLLIIDKEANPDRITVIFVPEVLGF